jgi:hypothetical protein
MKALKKKINSNKSKYSKSKYAKNSGLIEDSEDSFDSDETQDSEDFDDSDEIGDSDKNGADDSEDFDNFSEGEKDFIDVNSKGHFRSRGLFKSVWWKRGILKGFIVWLIIAGIFHFFDFVGLVVVIDWKRWFFFLIFIIIIGLAYEKFLINHIKL